MSGEAAAYYLLLLSELASLRDVFQESVGPCGVNTCMHCHRGRCAAPLCRLLACSEFMQTYCVHHFAIMMPVRLQLACETT